MDPAAASCRVPPRCRIRRCGLGLIAALLLLGGEAVAAGAPSGALSCSGCHGPAGAGGPAPSLAGRPAEEIVAALMQFRAGERAATVMDRIAKGFTDDEIRAIAAWFAGGADPAAPNSQP